MEPTTNASHQPTHFLRKPLLRADTFKIDANRPYLVKNLLLEGQVSLLVGPPNIGKSSIVAGLAARVSQGSDLGQMRVRRALVLYVAAEDPTGIAERALGHFRRDAAECPQFYIHGWPVDLSDDQEMKQFREEAQRLRVASGADRMLVIFDTLNLCIGDGDENSARDMSRIIGNAQQLAQTTRAHVLIVHHTSAADAAKPRGSTAMHGNIDTLLVLRKVEAQDGEKFALLTAEKQRSVRLGKPVLFEVGALHLGTDEEGEAITVPIARPTERLDVSVMQTERRTTPGSDAQQRADEVLRVLEHMATGAPGRFHSAPEIGAKVGRPFDQVRSNPDSLRKAVRRALDMLHTDGRVETDAAGAYRAAPRPTGTTAANGTTCH